MASNTVKITTNESGDWEILQYEDFYTSGHKLDIYDLTELLKYLGYKVECNEITDEEMEELC